MCYTCCLSLADYDSSTIPTSVTIPADEFSSCFEGDIIDDLIALEPDEQFALNIVSTDPTDVTVDPAQTVINIIDDDGKREYQA